MALHVIHMMLMYIDTHLFLSFLHHPSTVNEFLPLISTAVAAKIHETVAEADLMAERERKRQKLPSWASGRAADSERYLHKIF